MADDLKNRGTQDRARVNVNEEHEVRYWTEKWGVTPQALKGAVKKVGVSADAVARDLRQTMTHEVYRSSNGDRWLLSGSMVRHEPALASGGQITETPVDEFLARTGDSPENLALRKLLERRA